MTQLKSSEDMLFLVAEINCRRMSTVFRKWYRRLYGTQMPNEKKNVVRLLDRMTDEERDAYKAVRGLDVRYREGQYSHSDREERQVEFFCRFLLRLHGDSNFQKPSEISMNMGNLSTSRDIDPTSYSAAIYKVSSGELSKELE